MLDLPKLRMRLLLEVVSNLRMSIRAHCLLLNLFKFYAMNKETSGQIRYQIHSCVVASIEHKGCLW